jgi:hypothetical protein
LLLFVRALGVIACFAFSSRGFIQVDIIRLQMLPLGELYSNIGVKMAKVNAPLFSFNATGKLAKSLVYFGWKGLDAVRSYVIPANPQTAAQVTQRGYFTEAVAKIHTCLALATHKLDADDKAAYANLASTRATPRTWFNEIAKLWVDVRVAVKIPIIYTDGTISDPTCNTIDLIFYVNEKTAAQLAAGKFYFGSSKTSLIYTQAATVVASTSVALANSDCSAFLTAGNKYYVQFRPDAGDPCVGANSGIYSFTAD